MTPAARLHIDWTRCDGRGLCAELLPGLLRRDDWGYPVVRDGTREPAISPRDARYARAAVRRCPKLALSLISETGGD
ncbi:ferredoxin [Mycolicibacterium moriokaense]|nr:ferredoxin [Mycolicibacterium moriokaense]